MKHRFLSKMVLISIICFTAFAEVSLADDSSVIMSDFILWGELDWNSDLKEVFSANEFRGKFQLGTGDGFVTIDLPRTHVFSDNMEMIIGDELLSTIDHVTYVFDYDSGLLYAVDFEVIIDKSELSKAFDELDDSICRYYSAEACHREDTASIWLFNDMKTYLMIQIADASLYGYSDEDGLIAITYINDDYVRYNQ